jgi:subtilase family serine protease
VIFRCVGVSQNVFCDADASPDGACDYSNSNDVGYLAAGGTSFASPAFAGIMALINQQAGAAQGNPNYTLYKLAGRQYGTVGTACQSSNIAGGNACLFYDITDSSNAVPCQQNTPDCTPTNPNDSLGVLPGWSATTGFDLATGLGTVNAYNLVHSWDSVSSTYLKSQTAMTVTSARRQFHGTNDFQGENSRSKPCC